ncbi:MAG: hypothetical protein KG003_09420 [Bacteroidetes bacterium]|nr:hypothetical protein [Bacteroidota bacterium]
MTTKKSPGFLRKVLFLEISGFLSLGITLAVMATLLMMNLAELNVLWLPASGLVLVLAYIMLTIRYTRRSLHKIHELHTKGIYSYGRLVVNVLGVGLMVYGIFVFFATKDIWSDIGLVIFADLSFIIGLYCLYYNVTLSYLIQHEHLRHSNMTFWDFMMIVVAPIGLVVFSVYMLLSQEAITSATDEPDFNIPAAVVVEEFEKNDSLANAKYYNKILQFGGTVLEITGDSAKLVKLNIGKEDITANCGFDKSAMQTIQSVQAGDSVTLKCYCSGYSKPEDEESMLSEKSLDLVRCALVNKDKK